MFEKLNPIRIFKAYETKIATLEHSVDILLGEITERRTRGNPYTAPNDAIAEVAAKYEGTAIWGIMQVRNIIDVRAAFTIGQGIKIVDKGETTPGKKSREMEHIEQFIKDNDLDEEGPIDLAKEAEIEGRCLVKVIKDEKKRTAEYRFVSYSDMKYKIETDPDDYKKYIKATYKTLGPNGKDVVVEAKDFVYKRFAGRVTKVNEIMPKIAMVLVQCENLDKALADWREMNKYYASPTPYFECLDMAAAEKMQTALTKINWKIGKALAGVGKFQMVGMTDTGKDSLEKEIVTNAKMISGDTGIPIHFLGFPDLMSNRSTSTDLFEMIMASTAKERLVWAGFYEELFDKALVAGNSNYKTGVIKVEILQVSAAKIQELVEVWLPLFTAQVIDLDYMLARIPDADPRAMRKRLDEVGTRMLQQIKESEAQPGQEEPAAAGAGRRGGAQ